MIVAVVMSTPVMASAVFAGLFTITPAVLTTSVSAVAVPKTARTCDKQDNG